MKPKTTKLNLRLSTAILFISIFFTSDVYSQIHGSLQFNGQDNYIEVADNPLNTIGTGNFTIEAWVKGEESEQTQHPMILSNRGDFASGEGVFLSFHAIWGDSKYKMLNFQFDNKNYILINNGSFNASILDNQCHHVAVSRVEDVLFFYVDGNEIGTRNVPSSSTVSISEPMWIGKDRATNNTFNGLISQVRIWNIARSQEEIFKAKDVSLTGDESGLISYWEFNEGMGQVLVDKTNKFTGILGSDMGIDDQDPQWASEGCVEVTVPTSNLKIVSLKIYPKSDR